MLKQQARLLTAIAIILDAILVTASFLAAHFLRAHFSEQPHDIFEYFWFLLFILPTWFVSLLYFGLYESLRTKRTSKVLAQLFKAHICAAVVASSVVFFIGQHDFGKKLFILFVCIVYVAVASGKLGLYFILQYFRRHGHNTRNILLVGSGFKADEFIHLVEHHAGWGLRIIGILGASSAITSWGKSYPYMGELDDIIEISKREILDEVVFCLPGSELATIENYVYDLNQMGITSRMVLDFMDFPASKREILIFHDTLPMLTFYGKAFDATQLLAKRLLDIIGSSIGLLLFGMMLPVLAVAIKLDSPGPLFFGQCRVGEHGRRFRCWKLRTMYIDAEERKKELLAHNEMKGHMFKIKNDPRITPVGSFLRKSSLDEFPQFWNVLRGEMSLVGTRPPTPDEVAQYENWHHKRICIKPGITGLWQVSGRNQIQDFDQVARLDIQYIENWTFWMDIKILFRTLWVVTVGRGAS